MTIRNDIRDALMLKPLTKVELMNKLTSHSVNSILGELGRMKRKDIVRTFVEKDSKVVKYRLKTTPTPYVNLNKKTK